MVDNSITILYDNYLYNKNLKSGWGFSSIINKDGQIFFFDTGADSPTLLYNMSSLKIKPESIEIIVISHMHFDHTGGLSGLLSVNNNFKIFLPSSATKRVVKEIQSFGHNVSLVEKHQKIIDNIYSTGSLGSFIKEQTLIVKTEKGLIVITGCAHPGVSYIVSESKRLFNKDVSLVLGGFHLFSKSERDILKIIKQFKEMGVKYVAPCHCSGDKARALFENEYNNYYIDVGVGKTILFENLK